MLPLLWATLATVASAAAPNPDRPSVSRSGYLIAPKSLEIESGLAWQGGQRSAPSMLKLRPASILEVRLGADLSGLDGAPGLEAGAKFRLAETDDVGLAAFVASAVPTNAGEPWFGTAQLLLSVPIDRVTLQANAGLELVGTPGGVDFGGVPLVGLVGFAIDDSLSVFGEIAGLFGASYCGRGACRGVIDGGIGWFVTDSTILDAGLGWDLDNGVPIVQIGLGANFGAVRAL